MQGWRLDPLLLLCQTLTTTVAVWYGLETFKLRTQQAAELDRLPPELGTGACCCCARGHSFTIYCCKSVCLTCIALSHRRVGNEIS